MKLLAELDLEKILQHPNVAEELEDDDLAAIGQSVWDEWDLDRQSRSEWEERMKFAFGLALQAMEAKTFPWPGAANVKFPLVTIAALQYQARAYPALLAGPNIVKCRVFGDDPQGTMEDTALRIASHMSYQLLEEDEYWEDEMDRALIAQSIVGCAFKKSYFSPRHGHNISEHVLAKDLYINYYAKSLDAASRITQVLYFTSNDMEERRRSGLFLEWDEPPTEDGEPRPSFLGGKELLDQARDDQQGVQAPAADPSAPYRVLEQHRWLDLDGDGYSEPYVVFLREDTRKVLRIVARFHASGVKRNTADEIFAIEAINYFTKYTFIPSPDGGIYDLGFGSLLSPLNESINSSINLLLDAGTVANTAGGFLGRGVKFRSGESSFKPWEWKRVDSSGDDLRKGILPLPVREPSQVVFVLLKLLIDYGERIGMATDPQVGVPTGQNTPAETSRNMIREGQRVFSAIYKRTYRSLRDELRKLYRLNQVFLERESAFFDAEASKSKTIFKADYSFPQGSILPAADPQMSSDEEKSQRALILASRSAAVPGYNRYEVEKRLLSTLAVPDIEKIFPDPKGPAAVPPIPQPKVIVETMRLEAKKLDIQIKLQVKIAELMQEAELNEAKILELHAKAAKELAEAKGVETGHQIAALNASIGAARAKQQGIHDSIKIMHDIYESIAERKENGDNTGGIQRLAEASSHSSIHAVSGQLEGGGQGGVGAGGIPQ